MFYFGFAIYANDQTAFIQELIYAMPFFLICIIAAFKNIKYSAVLLALGYIGHGVYDVMYHQLFINSGMPSWWPEFCGTVDILIGLYLLAYAVRLPNKSIVQVNT